MDKTYQIPTHKIKLSPELFNLDDGNGEASVTMVVTKSGSQPERTKTNSPLIKTPWQKDK